MLRPSVFTGNWWLVPSMLFSDCDIFEMLTANGLPTPVSAELIKPDNHIYKIQVGATAAYLKVYTKDWYGGDVAGTGYCVDHETAAWRTLAARGLSVPCVLAAYMGMDNPLGRPFLLTEALDGAPLTEAAQHAGHGEFQEILAAVGRYFAAMHAIPFDYPGYVTSTEPSAPPSPGQWQHKIWTFEQLDREARDIWTADRQTVPPDVMEAVEALYRQHAPALAAAYARPHFVHGDCHASQFFLKPQGNRWHVTGVLDMEVASAGDCGWDFVNFGIEMAAQFPAETAWWRHIFEGYGQVPSFDLIRVRMLAAHHHSYAWIWPGTRERILRHILAADTWASLYDVDVLRRGV